MPLPHITPPLPPRHGTRLKFTADHSMSRHTRDSAAAPLFPPHLSQFQATPQAPEHSAYTRDLASKNYNLSWDSFQQAELWIQKEQATKFIELKLKSRRENGLNAQTTSYYNVCARKGAGGAGHYIKKHPERKQKIPSKLCDCSCHLTLKCYTGTSKVLGIYEDKHTHSIGPANARFTRLTVETRTRIAEMLRMGISHKRIVSNLIMLRLQSLIFYLDGRNPGKSF